MSIPANILGDKYETVRLIREGGMGKVYLVRHQHLDDLRVIKLMREQFASDPELRQRFLREAKTASRMKHPHIAQIYDFSVAEASDDAEAAGAAACIVMEYIDGQSLIELLRGDGPPTIQRTIKIAVQTLDALGYLHSQGYIHRDISPDNIMLTRDHRGAEQIKLIDLGIAKRIDQDATRRLTRTGAFIGKVFYAAPEQFDHGVLDQRSDIYSFAVVIYELLTGVCPIQGTTISQVIKSHLLDPPRDFTETDPRGRVPEPLREVVLRALSKKPEDRYGSAEEFAVRLQQAMEERAAALETGETIDLTDARTQLLARGAPSLDALDGPTVAVSSTPEEAPTVATPEEAPTVAAAREEAPIVAAAPEETPTVASTPQEAPTVASTDLPSVASAAKPPEPVKPRRSWLAAAAALLIVSALSVPLLFRGGESAEAPSSQVADVNASESSAESTVEPTPESTSEPVSEPAVEPASVEPPETSEEVSPSEAPPPPVQVAPSGAVQSAPPPPRRRPPPSAPPPPVKSSTLTIRPVAGVTVEIAGEVHSLDQTLRLDLTPGEYPMIFRAPGFKEQRRTVTLEDRGDHMYQVPTAFLKKAFARGDLIRKGDPDVVEPRRVGSPPLGYPREAVEAHLGETVRVKVSVLVDENGKVVEAQIEDSTFPTLGFNETALWSAQQTNYEPATRGGVPGKMWTTLQFTFKPPNP